MRDDAQKTFTASPPWPECEESASGREGRPVMGVLVILLAGLGCLGFVVTAVLRW
ncbi:hypothetical protein LJC48_01090 [Desulfovibrio sp. OttesenSCG-928-C06]|nr:hypothetical protein [Desulfovibrio sp. OttesenSCG-928-C06]